MLIKFLGGGMRLRFPASLKKDVFEVLRRADVSFWSVVTDDEYTRLIIPYYRRKRILAAFENAGIEWCEEGFTGSAALLSRFNKRYGMIIGAVICAFLIWMSEQVIWSVEVEGNSNVSDREIIELLDKLGCGVGDPYKKIDFDVLHNRFLMECKDISWIAVNMNGTHANVEVMETIHAKKEEDDSGYYNIVATENGHIELISCKGGEPVVKIYDTVLEGDLLISGVISYKQDTMTRLESAEGNVYARVFRDFQVNVPYKRKRKVYTGEKIEKKTVSFFNFDINLFLNSRIPYALCDKITLYNQIYLFDAIPLPIFVETNTYNEYEYREVVLTREEASAEAESLYRAELEKTLNGAQLLSKTASQYVDDNGITIKGSVYCLADIAKKVPLKIIETKEKETEEYGTENSQHTEQ